MWCQLIVPNEKLLFKEVHPIGVLTNYSHLEAPIRGHPPKRVSNDYSRLQAPIQGDPPMQGVNFPPM